MNVPEFIAKWQRVQLTERSAAQQHFLDLCEVLGHPKPAAADPQGEWFTFERGAARHGGGDGWADVWKRGFFGWEYKGKHKDLDAAYDQLLRYREALENPPLLVVCDMDRLVVRTNFTGTRTLTHAIALQEMGTPRNLEILRAVFHEPEKLKPGTTSEAITQQAAQQIGEIAQALRGRGLDPRDVAHFLDRIVFCLFAEDVGLLPDRLFTRLLEQTRYDRFRFGRLVGQLFDVMAHGGDFGLEAIRHFNGSLFNGSPVLVLAGDELESLRRAAQLDWAAVDPSIFGTLFERGMDPAKRSQLGAHYTSRADIETLVEPVVMRPLRREWDDKRRVVENLLSTGKKDPAVGEKPPKGPALTKARGEADGILHAFLTRLTAVKVLDPACGSGNFLYVVLQKLKDLEKEVIEFAMARGFSGFLPLVGPWQLHGIEVSPYAFDLAQMTVWIGYLQWTRANGFELADDPVLRAGTNFQCVDAILDLSDPAHPREPEWPRVDYIVGNPPFLGDKLMRRELGDDYVEKLRALYAGRVPGGADLCCYWFERARSEIEAGDCRRAGLLATQGIRGGANREVLARIKQTGDIFFAVSDRHWILDGASVHISMVGLDDGSDDERVLDGSSVPEIHTNLSGYFDAANARRLPSNAGLSFQGPVKVGAFEVTELIGFEMALSPNPNGRPGSDVLRPWANGTSLVDRKDPQWIIDFREMPVTEASLYEAPFSHVVRHVKPTREEARRDRRRSLWWMHGEVNNAFRRAVAPLARCLATCQTAKHRIYVWLDTIVLPAQTVIAFARSDDYFMGILHSRLHEVWALKLGTRLETRPRYTPTTCFETFPFPQPTPEQEAAIAAAAKELDALRTNWLNPADYTREEVLELPGSMEGPWARYVHGADARGIGTVRYPRLVPRDAECAAKLAKRTLTNLYNERPAWLDLAHHRLDAAVFAAYGWEPGLSDEAILEKLLALNLERAAG